MSAVVCVSQLRKCVAPVSGAFTLAGTRAGRPLRGRPVRGRRCDHRAGGEKDGAAQEIKVLRLLFAHTLYSVCRSIEEPPAECSHPSQARSVGAASSAGAGQRVGCGRWTEAGAGTLRLDKQKPGRKGRPDYGLA